MFIITKDGKSAKLGSHVGFRAVPLDKYKALSEEEQDRFGWTTVRESLDSMNSLIHSMTTLYGRKVNGNIVYDVPAEFAMYNTCTSPQRYVYTDVEEIKGFIPDLYYPQSIEDYTSLGIYPSNRVSLPTLGGVVSIKKVKEVLKDFVYNELGLIDPSVGINTFVIYRLAHLTYEAGGATLFANLRNDTQDSFVLGFNVGGVNGTNFALVFHGESSSNLESWLCRAATLDSEGKALSFMPQHAPVPKELVGGLIAVKDALADRLDDTYRFREGMLFF